ncbi:hypothetical protein EK21DRAFT_116648 [Setomelanomma holmii]|uniref:F-box domain-containing protein n=1 Tax=Setomelanomma holmii TaxID=210430 RepID=A0A9P4LHM3_9PLEO|nr:hypothetical protein EK21DRAFT_116648 [Setomelanomma holmii]
MSVELESIATIPELGSDHRLLSLEALPEELLQLIVAYLPTPALKNAALVSQTLNRHATDVLWQSVCLVDQWKLHHDDDPLQLDEGGRGSRWCDEHDDTPIIQTLYILATNPILASKVQTLTHRCHLPTPNIFDELPRMHFDAENLSQDGRLHILLQLAIRNMVNVQTLRIIYGHKQLSDLLVGGFLDKHQPRRVGLRRLWLENCSLSWGALQRLSISDGSGLESLRIRRLDIAPDREMQFNEFRPSRDGFGFRMHSGAGGFAATTVQVSAEETLYTDLELWSHSKYFDWAIWEKLPEIEDYVNANAHRIPIELPSFGVMHPWAGLLDASVSTLTSLSLDWILWRRRDNDFYDDSAKMLRCIADQRWPNLRAFQLRNAVLPQTKIPDDIFLLEDTFLDFLEYHQKLQCLAWPIDKFYSHVSPSIEVRSRGLKLVAHLANMLTDLRVDAQYAGSGEPLTDMSHSLEESQERIRRRKFITQFAPHMRRIKQIKMEGGLPRDEKREILRALHHCPLKKIVMIGVSYPVGNTWGAQGNHLKALVPGQFWDDDNLEEEDVPGIVEAYRRGFHMTDDFQYEPDFGWESIQAPLLQTIALHHANTVEELKICGYNGCPILSNATPVTDILLSALRNFDNLKQVVMSFWLLTWFEDAYRDTEIIKYWLDSRSPSSTALVVVTPPRRVSQDFPVDPGHFPNFSNRLAPPQDFNRWAVALKTHLSPSALAYRVARDIGPYLSPVAKNRPGGVRVRVSFCLGTRDSQRPVNDIFDLDVRIGRDDQVLEFTGPREEGEKGRWRQKLEARRWF